MNTNENKFAFVSGTSSGIGKATASELLKRDWKVAGIARRNTDIMHNNYKHLNIDMADIENLVRLLSKNLKPVISDKKYKRIALVNNAGVTGEMRRMEELDPVKLRDVYSVNLIAPVWLTGFVYKNKPNSARLRVINISSGASHNPYKGMTPYCGSKAALLMSGKIFYDENSNDKNLAIMSYEPATVDTEMQLQARSQSSDNFPSANIFKSLKANNMLVDPRVVAKDIADFLEDNEPGYRQKRFGNP